MLWLDSTLAAPIIGVRLVRTGFKQALLWEQCFADFMDRLVKEHKHLSISSREFRGYKVEAGTSGFTFELTHSNIVVSFTYTILQEPRPGAFPVDQRPKLQRYSKLLEKIYKYTEEILRVIQDMKDMNYLRIGIIADVSLDKDSLPPGLVQWIQHIGKPWNHELVDVEHSIVAKLSEGKNFRDQCHHKLKFSEDLIDEHGYRFTLDWQRVYDEPILVTRKGVSEDLASCRENAIQYFERFAQGDLDYE